MSISEVPNPVEGSQVTSQSIPLYTQHIDLANGKALAPYRLGARRLREAFHLIGEVLASDRELPAILEIITRLAAEMLDAGASWLWLVESDSDWLKMAASFLRPGYDNCQISSELLIRVGEGCVGKILQEMRPLSFQVPMMPPHQESVGGGATRSFQAATCLGAPLIAHQERLGVLAVARLGYSPFKGSDTKMLESFARQAALAIERARLFERLIEERDELAAIVRDSADGILVLDSHRRILEVNPALERMLGCRREELIGRTCWEVVSAGVERSHTCRQGCPFDPPPNDQMPTSALHEILTPAGKKLVVSVSYGVVRNAHGEIQRVVATMRDVSREAEMERLRRDFVSTVSHELRTPLALLKGYIATMLRPDLKLSPEVYQRFLQDMNETADRLNRLIDDLLTVSRSEVGRLRLDRRPCDLVEIVRRAVYKARMLYSPARTFEEEFVDQPLPVCVDSVRIEQVLANLLSNAVKFSPPDQPITVRVARVGNLARVSVTDRGIGIAEEHQARIFEKFYRVETGLARETSGIGLGLHIAKNIVDAHGGRIWVNSRPGHGSTFGFDVPLSLEKSDAEAQIPMPGSAGSR